MIKFRSLTLGDHTDDHLTSCDFCNDEVKFKDLFCFDTPKNGTWYVCRLCRENGQIKKDMKELMEK